ncbi:MAG: nuclear transport factor 2 family protein [Steroidobacteraceae bacterium]
MPDRIIVDISPAGTGARFATLPHDDYAEVMGVIAAYGRYYDDDRIDDFMGLIAGDAVYYPNWPGVAPDEVSGHETLRGFFGGARAHARSNGVQPRHYATNVILAKATPTSAHASVSMLYAESQAGGAVAVKMIGQYDYQLEKRAGRWLITRWSMRYDK